MNPEWGARVRRWLSLDLDRQSRKLVRRLVSAGIAFATAMFAGAVGYQLIGRGRWSLHDSLYMSVITLSTVGFGETLEGMEGVPGARTWTAVLILLGSGTLLYFASTLTALIVEGDLRDALRRGTMRQSLAEVQNHVIICGVGSTGVHVLAELLASRIPLVIVDSSLERIERVLDDAEGRSLLYVHGDATEDQVLEEAGIHRARGLIAALHDDRENLFVTVTARALSDRVRIVAKAVEHENVAKLERGGADVVVAPALIGGVRLASEMVRPSVVRFFDALSRDREQTRRIEEIPVSAGSSLIGCRLADAGIREIVDALVIAIRDRSGRHEYNPSADWVLEEGMVLIVLVRTDEIELLKLHVNGDPGS
ncbi:MAG TPA: potassium channel protein [Deltaproteobacteria bacterium]|nr:potassium channel protein [Deltaproteobacteria bacterium]